MMVAAAGKAPLLQQIYSTAQEPIVRFPSAPKKHPHLLQDILLIVYRFSRLCGVNIAIAKQINAHAMHITVTQVSTLDHETVCELRTYD